MKFLRNILIIFVPVYFLITWTRNKLYDLKLLKSESYDIPVICVGNLTVGGTGKSPMIEYLLRLLKDDYRIATLSRGYKRNTSGFLLADDKSSAESLGDEPYQFFRKFNNIQVAVDSNRSRGIAHLMRLDPAPELILLDDAYQHRRVNAGMNILLTSYDKLFIHDMLLPTGDLREPVSGANRADIIVVTKCPDKLSEAQMNRITKQVKMTSEQQVFFSTIRYSEKIFNQREERSLEYLRSKSFTLVSGIANASYLVQYLESHGYSFNHIEKPDHYRFDAKEISDLSKYDLILTTEKDYVRMLPYVTDENIWYLPIETEIIDGKDFNAVILNFLET